MGPMTFIASCLWTVEEFMSVKIARTQHESVKNAMKKFAALIRLSSCSLLDVKCSLAKELPRVVENTF